MSNVLRYLTWVLNHLALLAQIRLDSSPTEQDGRTYLSRDEVLSQGRAVQAEEGKMAKSGGLKQKLLLAIPTVFDLAATVLMNIGLLNVTASVYQMMRGAEMLFAALFSVLFLKRHLNKFHYLGILCCVVNTCSPASHELKIKSRKFGITQIDYGFRDQSTDDAGLLRLLYGKHMSATFSVW
jgi:hypothetical protein